MLSSCSTKPSIVLTSPVIDVPKVTPKPPAVATQLCEPLLTFDSDDILHVIKISMMNAELYFKCASGKKAATIYIKSLQEEE